MMRGGASVGSALGISMGCFLPVISSRAISSLPA